MNSACLSNQWTSGRILTEAQRIRKREVDRISHRRRKELQRKRMAALERELQILIAHEPESSCDQRTAQNVTIEEENARVKEGADIVREPKKLAIGFQSPSLVYTTPNPSKSALSSNYISSWPTITDPPEAVAVVPTFTTLPAAAATPSTETDFPAHLMFECDPSLQPLIWSEIDSGTKSTGTSIGKAELSDIMENNTTETCQNLSIHPSANGAEHTDTCSIDVNISRLCSFLHYQVIGARRNQICLDDRMNQNILILAVFEGWDVVKHYVGHCPLWDALEQLDRHIFRISGLVERLVMLRMIHLMALSHHYPETYLVLPKWYRARPAQCQILHNFVIDYFAWPGLRERLVFSGSMLLTNSFWRQFALSFRFEWPYDVSEIYKTDPSTKLSRFSGCFQNYLGEIAMWRMDHAFFASYPDLADDILPSHKFHVWPSNRYVNAKEQERNRPIIDSARAPGGTGVKNDNVCRAGFIEDNIPTSEPKSLSYYTGRIASLSHGRQSHPAPLLDLGGFKFCTGIHDDAPHHHSQTWYAA